MQMQAKEAFVREQVAHTVKSSDRNSTKVYHQISMNTYISFPLRRTDFVLYDWNNLFFCF